MGSLIKIKNCALPFPEIKEISKDDLLLEFFPKIYWREKIEKLEAELKDLPMNKSVSAYSVSMMGVDLQAQLRQFASIIFILSTRVMAVDLCLALHFGL